MPQRNSMRLSLQIVLFGFVAFIVFNIASYYFLSTTFYQRLSQENRAYSETVALSISSFLDMAYGVGAELSQSQEMKGMKAEAQHKLLLDRFSQYDFFENFVIKRVPDGSTMAQVRGPVVADQEQWWLNQTVQEGRPLVSQSFYSFSGDGKRR